jgi:hypothetical protein
MRLIPVTQLNDSFGFSRAGDATYFDEDGLLQIAGTDVLRYRFINGERAGIIFEPEELQLFESPDTPTSGYWDVGVSISGSASDPRGGTNAVSITSSGANNYLEPDSATFSAGTYVCSLMIKPGTCEELTIGEGANTATFNLTGDGGSSGGIIEKQGDYYRCFFSIVSGGSFTPRFTFADGTADIFGANLIQSDRPSSYIDGQKTRPADVRPLGTSMVYSNIPVPDTTFTDPDGDGIGEAGATIYDAGNAPYDDLDRVIQGRFLYESNTGNNNDAPDIGVNKSPATWSRVSATNRYRPFDFEASVDVKSRREDYIEYIISAVNSFDFVALYGLLGSDVFIETMDSTGRALLTVNEPLISNEGINDFFDWCFRPRITKSTVTTGDAEPAFGGFLRILVTSGETEAAQLGKVVFGFSELIGEALSPAKASLIDLSRTRRNEFGNLVLNPGRQIFSTSIDVRIESDRAAEVKRIVSNLRGAPAAVVGEPNIEFVIVYGRVTDLRFVFNSYPDSEAVLEVEDF